MQLFLIDDHHFAVIPDQVFSRPAHGDALGEHPQFELPQPLVGPLVSVRNQGADVHAARHGRLNCLFDLLEVEAENDEVEGFSGAVDSLQQGVDAVFRQDDQLHAAPSPPALAQP